MTQMRPIWVRRLNQSLQWYDRDAKLIIDTNMTETPWPKLTHLWLRRPKKIVFAFRFYTLETATRLKITTKKIGRLSHKCASLGQGVSVILVSMISLASQSYHCKLWFKRLNHISLSSKPRVSLISVSFGSFWRSHIRHPLYLSENIR